jgi:histidinol-phosphate phosphatase family protein
MEKIIFLDRDGVINVEPSNIGKEYITKIKEFEFLPLVIPVLKKLTEKKYSIYIISNQAGISKELFTEKDLEKINKYMLDEFKKQKIHIAGVFYCPHKKEDNCNCRKPKTGMLEKALEKEGNFDRNKIFLIGDQDKDIMTAKNFGCKSIFILSGKSKIYELFKWEIKPDYIALDLYDAVFNIVLKNEAGS